MSTALDELPQLRDLRHSIEYDPRWPDGKPNYCLECDEVLSEGDESCAHNAALEALVVAVGARISQELLSKRPHIPVSTAPDRRECIVMRDTLNRAARWTRTLTSTP